MVRGQLRYFDSGSYGVIGVKPILGLGLALALVASACAREVGDDPADLLAAMNASADGGADADGGMDGGLFGNADRTTLDRIPDAAVPSDASPTVDAFFINDPPPPYCGPDGGMSSAGNPGGTPDCPGDKNREGCPCPEEGLEADCWPGKRANRNHGICKDGRTTCRQSDEFGLRWGPCEGYVLPQEGALAGPAACGCFSSGTWTLSNLSPCIYPGGRYLYSSTLDSDGSIDCGVNVPDPPPVPDEDWSTASLNVDCAGQFRLCFTIKAGDVENPRDSDCVIMEECVDVWYPEAGNDQELPNIPAWSSPNSECAMAFVDVGGYGEMSVIGTSVECDEIDDGEGNPYVFHRTNYCPPSCQDTPETDECRECKTGGSGDF